MSNSLRPYGPQSTRPLCLWDFSGKNTGVGCYAFLQDLPKRVIKPASLTSPVLAGGIFTTELPGKLNIVYILTENCKIAHHLIASLMDQTVKNLPAMQKTAVRSLNLDDPWRKEWLSTPVFLPGDVHGQRSLGGYQSMGWQRVGHD